MLHHPGAARAVRRDARPGSDGEQKGFPVLRELLETARAEPKLTTAQLVERWRERPEGARLAELAGRGEPGRGRPRRRAGSSRSLLERIGAELGPEKRLNELIELARERRLTDQEQKEFQGLLGARGPAARR